jgi:hypothetical protein
MGLNARAWENPTDLVLSVTERREARESALWERIRAGELTLRSYLTEYKGYSAEHAALLEPQFRTAIFGT